MSEVERKQSILFVDDSQNILSGLRRMLSRKRKDWDMYFELGGKAALSRLEKQQFDVVVTDMRMPEVDGATLLNEVQSKYPQTVRIVLSGYTEFESALRAVPVAHQFLTKPCDPNLLSEVIVRACNLQRLIDEPLLQKIISKIGSLPSLPKTYYELSQALLEEDVTFEQAGEIIQQDIALTAKILQLVNSAFFSLRKEVSSVTEAVGLIGFNTLKKLTLCAEVFSAFDNDTLGDFSITKLQEDAILHAKFAKYFIDEQFKSEDAFLAGMLCNIGYLIMAEHLPNELENAFKKSKETGHPLHLIEEDLYGVTHGEIGAYLLGIWGLPYNVIEAVAYHHKPQQVEHSQFDVLDAVYVADVLLQAHKGDKSSDDVSKDLEYLNQFNMADDISRWQEMALELAAKDNQ